MNDYEVLFALRSKVKGEIIDSLLLKDSLKSYASPRNVISKWLKRGDIIQLKKGLYLFGPQFRKNLVHLEGIANQLFGPSYVSCEYALQYHGLIPEAVHEVTCVTTKRNKTYDTPLARFSYRHLNENRYPIGVAWLPMANNMHALIATKEKALADTLFLRRVKTQSAHDLLKLLLESYRIQEEDLRLMDIMLMLEIAQHYHHPTIDQLPFVLKEVKNAS